MGACLSPGKFKKTMHYNQPKTIKLESYQSFTILMACVQFHDLSMTIKMQHLSKKLSKFRHVKKLLTNHFRFLITSVLSTADRARYWNHKTRFVYYKLRYKDLYFKILREKKSDYTLDIQKDLDRTFPHLSHFQKGGPGIPVLERILLAISIYYKKLGYC